MPLKRKESMTVFDIAAIVKWANERLRGLRLTNIYMVENVFLLRFKHGGKDLRVAIEPGKRIHPTSYDVVEKAMPPPLVMAIRKRVRGVVLDSVEQLGFDRVVVLRFANGFKLVAELLPRGVVALLDNSDKIIVATEYREMRDRSLRPGQPYTPPPLNKLHPETLTTEIVGERVRASGRSEAAAALVRGLGYPGEVVEEALLRIGVKPNEQLNSLLENLSQLVEVLKRLYREALEGKLYLVSSRDEVITVTPFEPKALSEYYGVSYTTVELEEGFDKFFVEAQKMALEREAAKQLEAERKKLERSLKEARHKLEELEEKRKRLERLAELLALNINSIYEALECARSVRERAGWEYIAGSCPGVVEADSSRGVVKLSIGGEIVEVSLKADPQQLVVDLYRRIGELEAKIERAKQAVRELEERLEKLAVEEVKLRSRARSIIRRREWFEKYHWMVTSNGFLVLAGRDASQNESLVRKHLGDNDIFMHADIHGAAAVVVKTNGRKPSEKDLEEAAVLAAVYSKAWKEGLASIDVYWVKGSQVSKSPPPGEYLAHGAFMVYGKRNYIRGVRLELGVGLEVSEEAGPRIIIGPPELVAKRSIVYAVLTPGREDPSSIASRLKKMFVKLVPDDVKPVVEALSVDEIRMHVPGPSELKRVGKGLGNRREGVRGGGEEAESQV